MNYTIEISFGETDTKFNGGTFYGNQLLNENGTMN
jgi:hypothetical protein